MIDFISHYWFVLFPVRCRSCLCIAMRSFLFYFPLLFFYSVCFIGVFILVLSKYMLTKNHLFFMSRFFAFIFGSDLGFFSFTHILNYRDC